jgi:hypothetical protein
MKHTPAPWKIEKRSLTAINTENKHIAMVNYSYRGLESDVIGEEHEANARLIASAPELLEALNHCAEAMESIDYDEDSRIGRAIKQAYEAIAKAGGA